MPTIDFNGAGCNCCESGLCGCPEPWPAQLDVVIESSCDFFDTTEPVFPAYPNLYGAPGTGGLLDTCFGPPDTEVLVFIGCDEETNELVVQLFVTAEETTIYTGTVDEFTCDPFHLVASWDGVLLPETCGCGVGPHDFTMTLDLPP
jgi:hypothetical protein